MGGVMLHASCLGTRLRSMHARCAPALPLLHHRGSVTSSSCEIEWVAASHLPVFRPWGEALCCVGWRDEWAAVLCCVRWRACAAAS